MVLLTMFLVVLWITCSTPQHSESVSNLLAATVVEVMWKFAKTMISATQWQNWIVPPLVWNMFLFSLLFGEDEPILTIFFQWGWFKHQLDNHSNHSLNDVMHPSYEFVPRWPEILKALPLSWKYLEWMILHRSWAITDNELQIVVVVWWVDWVIQALVVYIIHVVVQCAFTAWLLVALHVVAQGFQQMDGKDWPPILLSLFCGILTCTCWTMAVRNSSTCFFCSGCVCMCAFMKFLVSKQCTAVQKIVLFCLL